MNGLVVLRLGEADRLLVEQHARVAETRAETGIIFQRADAAVDVDRRVHLGVAGVGDRDLLVAGAVGDEHVGDRHCDDILLCRLIIINQVSEASYIQIKTQERFETDYSPREVEMLVLPAYKNLSMTYAPLSFGRRLEIFIDESMVGELLSPDFIGLANKEDSIYFSTRLGHNCYEKLEQRKIAEQMNISVATVKKHQSLAMRFLKTYVRAHLKIAIILLFDAFLK